MDREIRMLLDERAIGTVLNTYCLAMDTGQTDRWLDCFTADALYEVVLPNGATFVRLQGTEDLTRFIAAYPVRPGHKHVYVTPVFTIDPDAGEAEVSTYFFMLAGDSTQAGISSLGRSQDHFVRTDKGWRIKARRVVTEGMAVG